MARPPISRRKADHIEVAASGRADFATSTLLEEVHLVHDALPELRLDDVDLETQLLGARLQGPIVVTGMTGGTDEARAINRDLAVAAQRHGLAMGVGSQRAMAEHPELADSYRVRDAAPDVFLIGNIGAVQAASYGVERIARLAEEIEANALAIHLNPAQELIQPEGDRDFRGALKAIEELAAGLSVPVLVKETGCGVSAGVARRLAAVGISTVDVSGAGGTSWIAVEAERAQPGSPAKALGDELRDWGLPTAVSVVACAAEGLDVIASGGIRSGSDIVRAMALGACAGGFAAPILRAQRGGGADAAASLLEQTLLTIRTLLLLAGARSAEELRSQPAHLGPELRAWLSDLGLRREGSQ